MINIALKTLKLQLFVELVVVFCYNGDVLILAVWSIFFQAGVVFILWLALMLMIVAYIVVVVSRWARGDRRGENI